MAPKKSNFLTTILEIAKIDLLSFPETKPNTKQVIDRKINNKLTVLILKWKARKVIVIDINIIKGANAILKLSRFCFSRYFIKSTDKLIKHIMSVNKYKIPKVTNDQMGNIFKTLQYCIIIHIKIENIETSILLVNWLDAFSLMKPWTTNQALIVKEALINWRDNRI